MKILACTLLLSLSAAVAAQSGKNLDAYSRIYRHKDGTQTKTVKDADKNEIHESTYRHNILICKRVFYCDTKGRTRQGVIYDGRMNPLGSILYGYDRNTDQLVEEQQYNKEGTLVRRLFYPGALKNPEFANRFVAFTFDPNDPKAKPVLDKAPARPNRPVQSDQDEFEPGVPLGKVPAVNPAADVTPAATITPAAPKRARLFQKKS